MTDDRPSHRAIQTEWAKLIIDGLRASGVHELIISPGSRSTPLVLAAAQNRLPTRVIIDERSAAFFALGLIRESGRAVALVCTSGTAGAHYFPAVIEANQSHLPLVVVTADRPHSLMDCAAPQVVDQCRLYGHHTRHFVDLGSPDSRESALRAVRRQVAQSVAIAHGPVPGPVHINARFIKPLEPPLEPSRADQELAAQALQIATSSATRVTSSLPGLDEGMIGELAGRCHAAERGMIVCGPAGRNLRTARVAIERLAKKTGFPLLAEGASQLRFVGEDSPVELCDAFDIVLGSGAFTTGREPDLIIEIGGPPTSASYTRFIESRPHAARFVISESGWNDPSSSAIALVRGDVATIVTAVADALGGFTELDNDPHNEGRSRWRAEFARANELAWQGIDSELSAAPDSRPPLIHEGQVARTVVARLPERSLLAVGNSLPIRSIDNYARGKANLLDVWSQRGANGIDGLIAGAAGAASFSKRPVALLIGDVSFFHDLSSLAVAKGSTAPLIIVVVDNGGGRIFEQLPVATHPVGREVLSEMFLTRPSVDIEQACAAFGVPYLRTTTREGLSDSLGSAVRAKGCTVVHALVNGHSARDTLARAKKTFNSTWAAS